jgi:cofilin
VLFHFLIYFSITSNPKYSYKVITFKIEGDVVTEAEKLESADFDEFLGVLPADQGRFCVLDFAYETADGRPTDKVVFVSWIPDTCKVREKMKYSGTKEAVKNAFVGISVNINATDMSEITAEGVVEACNKV